MNFQEELTKKTKEIEAVIREYLPAEEGFSKNYGSGYELQYAGRRQAPSPHADAGDLPGCLAGSGKLCRALYGSNGDDPYPFSDP